MAIYYPRLLKHNMKTCSNHKIISKIDHTLMSSTQVTSITDVAHFFR